MAPVQAEPSMVRFPFPIDSRSPAPSRSWSPTTRTIRGPDACTAALNSAQVDTLYTRPPAPPVVPAP